MQDELWNVFSDTGDPVCYLIYRAGKRARQGNTTDGNGGGEPGIMRSPLAGKTAGPCAGEKTISLPRASGACFAEQKPDTRSHTPDAADERPFI